MIDRNLSHKNLVKLLGVSLDGNPIYIVTEFCGKVSDWVQSLKLCVLIRNNKLGSGHFLIDCYHLKTSSVSITSVGVYNGLRQMLHTVMFTVLIKQIWPKIPEKFTVFFNFLWFRILLWNCCMNFSSPLVCLQSLQEAILCSQVIKLFWLVNFVLSPFCFTSLYLPYL